MKALTASPALYAALDTQAAVFEHPFGAVVLPGLIELARSRKPVTGAALSNKLIVLIRQGLINRSELVPCYNVTPFQVIYISRDKRYKVTIQQRNHADGVVMVWQVASRKAGRNTFSFAVSNDGSWTLGEAEISDLCKADLKLLAEVGGEVLGFFTLRGIFPEDSPFFRAVQLRLGATAEMKGQVAGEGNGE